MYLRYTDKTMADTPGRLEFSEKEVLSPYAKFQAEPATDGGEGFVHIKCLYINKYLRRASPTHWWILAAADQPNEDRNSWECTLFHPQLVRHEGQNAVVRLLHVQLGHYAMSFTVDAELSETLYANSGNPDESELDMCTVIELERTELPNPFVLNELSSIDSAMAASAVFSVVQKYKNMLQLDEATDTKVVSWLNSSIKQQIIDELREMESFLQEATQKKGGADEAEDVLSNSISRVLDRAYVLEDVVDTSLLEELRRSAYISLKTSGIYIRKIIHSVKSFVKATDDSRWKSKLEEQLTRISTSLAQLPCNDHAAGIPSHLMGCLLYVGMFPKNMAIPVRRLIRLWLAEGFVFEQSQRRSSDVGDGDDKTCLEDLAMEYLGDLQGRGVIRTSISDGGHKSCRLSSGELYNKCSLQAEKIGLLHIHKASTGTPPPPRFPVRRVVEYSNIKDYPQSDMYVKSLRSFVSFNFQKKDTEAAQIGEFVRRITVKRGYSLLKVLDLERVYKPALPDNIGNLYNLRYLGLRWTFLDALPSSVENLTLLQTLDLKHTYIKHLPIQLHKMRELRHLYLNDIPLQGVLPAIEFTNCMQTLSGWLVDQEKILITSHFPNLKKLGLTCHSSCSEALGSWISTVLTELRSLKLTCKVDGEPSSLLLMSLVSLEKLTNIYLIGKIPKLEKQRFEFPCNLRVLTLSFSILEEDPMPTLGQLPNLVVLGLLASSYTGTRLFCAQDGFGSLQVLKLWGLKNLEEWMVGQRAMKSLQELDIRLCDKLENVPTRLLNPTGFKKLTLSKMPKNMVADVQDYFKRKKRSSRKTYPILNLQHIS